MRKNLLILALSIILIPILNGCSKDDADFKKRCEEAEIIVYEAYLDKDYKRILTLTDSVRKDGLFSEGKACYWMGYAYDRLMRKRMAELYWKTGIAAVENSTDDEDVRVYAGITNRLTGHLTTWTEYEAALKVAIPATERLKSLGRDTISEYTNMLIYIGCCRSRLGLSDKNTFNSLEEAYSAHLNNIKHHPNAISYRDAIVGVINISYNYLEIADYENARVWLERMKQLIDGYEKQADMRPDYAEKQQARYDIYMARALEGLGRKDEAAEAYRKFCETSFFKTAEGNMLASDYLRLAGRWQDAADNFGSMNEMMKAYGTSYSLENIQKMLLKKYEVNMKAGRLDTARAVSISITEQLDSAITLSRSAEAREEAAVHQKELEMTAENERYMRQQHITRLAIMAAVILLLFVYIVVRHRVQARLAKVKAEQERIQSELRIARDIQMSMVPDVFPEREGINMFAYMKPAKEVGGDLYGYILHDDKLYVAVGDVSGKGVPASLFMAQATRLFQTMAKQNMMPAEICTRMNDALSGEDNENGMFVTFWLGLVDLPTGHLYYCNAGHNPPVIGGGDNQCEFLEMNPNAPIGLWPGLEYEGEEIDCIKNRPLLIYTDGLNEAENPQLEQFGDERLLATLRETNFENAVQVIESLKQAVESFRNGAEPNDDLTMMCLNIS